MHSVGRRKEAQEGFTQISADLRAEPGIDGRGLFFVWSGAAERAIITMRPGTGLPEYGALLAAASLRPGRRLEVPGLRASAARTWRRRSGRSATLRCKWRRLLPTLSWVAGALDLRHERLGCGPGILRRRRRGAARRVGVRPRGVDHLQRSGVVSVFYSLRLAVL